MARLSAKTRQNLPKGDFARPGKGSGPKGAGPGSYPIPDKSMPASLIQLSGGAPDVKKKVYAKYPGMKPDMANKFGGDDGA